MPVVTAERPAGQLVLHDVIEIAEAGVHLQLAIVHDIPSAAESRSELVAEREVNRIGDGVPAGGLNGARLERWNRFTVETHAEVQRHAVAYVPAILKVKRVVVAGNVADSGHAVLHGVIPVQA